MNTARHLRGFTLAEVLTALVVLVALIAVAIPMWRNHLLRVRRADAMSALVAVQSAQDRFFGRNARYAAADALTHPPPDGLGLKTTSERGFFQIELNTSEDALKYTVTARARPQAQGESGDAEDTRCAQLSMDHLGSRRATDKAGVDRSGDCWR